MFLVIWHHAQERTDHYETFETLTEATERYEELIKQDRVYTCSLAPVLRSTDYDTAGCLREMEGRIMARENMQ